MNDMAGGEKKVRGESGITRPEHRVTLPGFLTEEEVGLGDVIKKVSAAIGLRHCGPCERRAAILNKWLVFSGTRE
jgi:hypothetical protein